MLDLKSFAKVIKRKKLLFVLAENFALFVRFFSNEIFGAGGIFGVSILAIVITLCSINRHFFWRLSSDYGDEEEKAAFGLVGLLCVPAFPMVVFSIVRGTPIDWMPVISILIPMVLGAVFSNLDPKVFLFIFTHCLINLLPGVSVLAPFFGFTSGSGINLVQAFSNSLSGIALTVIFYLAMLPILYFVERVIFKKDDGIVAASVAGLSVAVSKYDGSYGYVNIYTTCQHRHSTNSLCNYFNQYYTASYKVFLTKRHKKRVENHAEWC